MYICIHVATNSGTSQVIRELQQSGRNLAALDSQQQQQNNVVAIDQATLLNKNQLNLIESTKLQTDLPPPPPPPPTPAPLTVFDKIKNLTNCLDKPMIAKTQQRGDYWVLYNYIKATKTFKCQESITYTTHADYSFMDNLVPLLEKWRGPISIAMHAPGSDFKTTLESIAYLRDCATDDDLVKEYVTFHIYFSTKHVPKEVWKNFFINLFCISKS